MKNFQQFNEDLKQLQRDLDSLDKQQEPKSRLAAKRKNLLQRSKSIGSEFNARAASEVADKKERMA